MNTRMRVSLITAALVGLFITTAFVVYGQRKENRENVDQWEYLVVSGGNANLSTAGNESYPAMRKQPDGAFAREYFPLERNLDKLGAKGWELVAVQPGPNEPVSFFKRPKETN